MPHAALPFQLKRSEDEYTSRQMITRVEQVHGLLVLDGERLVVQWRRALSTQKLGSGMKTEREVDAVEEVVLPLSAVAGARVPDDLWSRWFRPRVVLIAADLKAFDRFAGGEGLELEHPAELVLSIRRRDRLRAVEFAAELELAVAQMSADRPLGAGHSERGDRETLRPPPKNAPPLPPGEG
ncbi:MAG: hypothetical protein KJP18_15565 [Gemmatimonadetes bacterium]|nr:hypothetical protein [Gemmatimonadota bacterium]NNK61645.1 hypothetical protein [Gemmatimonadota bacterium]